MSTQPTPTIWTESPTYLAAVQKLTSLCALEGAIIAELKDIEAVFTERAKKRPWGDTSHLAKDVVAPSPARKLSDAARALLGTAFAPAPTPPPPADADKPRVDYHDPFHARQHQLCAKLAEVREAIAVLQPEATRLHAEASIALCKSLTPAYATLAARWFKAAAALAASQIELDEFHSYHASAQLGYLRPFSASLGMGNPLEPHSAWRRMFVAGAEGGWWALSDLPPALLRKPEPHPVAPLPTSDAQPAKAGR